jgi:hypothetical protein
MTDGISFSMIEDDDDDLLLSESVECSKLKLFIMTDGISFSMIEDDDDDLLLLPSLWLDDITSELSSSIFVIISGVCGLVSGLALSFFELPLSIVLSVLSDLVLFFQLESLFTA